MYRRDKLFDETKLLLWRLFCHTRVQVCFVNVCSWVFFKVKFPLSLVLGGVYWMASRQAKANTGPQMIFFLRPFVFRRCRFFCVQTLEMPMPLIRQCSEKAMVCCKIGHYLICILIIRVHELLVDDMIFKRSILSSYDHKVIIIFFCIWLLKCIPF